MRVKVNGEFIDVKATTVAELLSELGIRADRVAVEVNLEIVKRERFDSYQIREGDSIEIVNFVGGG